MFSIPLGKGNPFLDPKEMASRWKKITQNSSLNISNAVISKKYNLYSVVLQSECREAVVKCKGLIIRGKLSAKFYGMNSPYFIGKRSESEQTKMTYLRSDWWFMLISYIAGFFSLNSISSSDKWRDKWESILCGSFLII